MTTSMIAWHCTMRTPLTTSTDTHMSAARIVSSVAQCQIICTRTVAEDVWVLSCHLHSHVHVSVSPRLDSPFLFPIFFHQFLKFVVNLHSPQNEKMDSTDEFLPLHRLWVQGPRLLRDLSRALHAAPGLAAALLRQSLFCGPRLRWRYTRRHAPPSTSSASLSLSTRRLVCQSEKAQKHRLGLYLMSKKSKFLQSAKQELVNTNFKQLEPKNSNNEINNFFKDSYYSKIWNYVKLIREVSLKWKN